MKLAELEQYFAAAATTSGGPIAGLDQVFLGSEALPASARLAIYNRAYFYRLLDALAAVFAQTRRVLGHAEFERVGLQYLVEHPSQHPAVERVGRFFADHLRGRSTHPDALADLAALEWARLCALVAPNPERVASAQDLDPAAFPGSRLHFVPALHWLELDPHALRAFLGENLPLSAGGERCAVAVWRQGHTVRHEALEALEAEALAAALGGAAMAEVCALFDSGAPTEDSQRAYRAVVSWFERQWLARIA